jgi:hypothetical protein
MINQSPAAFWFVLFIMLALGLYSLHKDIPSNTPPMTPGAMQSSFADVPNSLTLIRNWALEKEDARKLSSFYTSFAKVLEHSSKDVVAIKDSNTIREVHLRGGLLAFNGDLANKYPGLAQEIDNVFIGTLQLEADDSGYKNKTLSANAVQELRTALLTLANTLKR